MKKLLALLFVTTAIISVHSQDLELGWSLGDIGWSHGFTGNSNDFTVNLMNIYLSFDVVNLTLKTSVISMAGRINNTTAPSYTSFFPLELIFTPIRWGYANLELYARGAWETATIGDTDNFTELSSGLFGSAGLRLGFVPADGEILGYRGYMISVFAEYTSRNEIKAGINVDILDIVILGVMALIADASNDSDTSRY